jgi:hypothetical protein
MKASDSIHAAWVTTRNQILSCIPQAYRDDASVLNTLYTWFLIGILMRVLVMPFAFHGDILSTYHRSYLLASEGCLQYLNPHETIQAAFLIPFSYITPAYEYIVWSGSTTVLADFWVSILDSTHIFRTIFLFKTPYLLFDILICITLLYIFKNEKEKGLRAFIFWCVNPVVIFAVYIFGRFEVIPLFFILAAIYYIKEDNIPIASLLLGIALVDRMYIILFVPFFFIFCCPAITDKIKAVLITFTPLLIYNIITKVTTDALSSLELAESMFLNYLLGLQVDIGTVQSVYAFVIGYGCIFLFAHYMRKNDNPLLDFITYSLLVLLLLYTVSVFHPHYFIWFIPFLALYYGYIQDSMIMELHCLQIILFTFSTFYYGPELAAWLFASIHPVILTAVSSPAQFIDQFFQVRIILNTARSLFSAVTLFMIARIFMNMMRGHHHER